MTLPPRIIPELKLELGLGLSEPPVSTREFWRGGPPCPPTQNSKLETQMTLSLENHWIILAMAGLVLFWVGSLAAMRHWASRQVFMSLLLLPPEPGWGHDRV